MGYLLGILIFAIGIYWGYKTSGAEAAVKAEKEQKEKERQRVEETRRPISPEEFYFKCKEVGIAESSTQAGIARIVLIARNNNLTGTDEELLAQYKNGKRLVEKRERDQLIAKAASREKYILEDNTKYLSYRGRDKVIQMCLDEAAPNRGRQKQYLEEIPNTAKSAAAMYRGTAERESSWAIQGGIASGFAGPVAGVAAALDTQRKNAEIRERNDALAKNIATLGAATMQHNMQQAKLYDEMASKWEQRAETAKMKLIQEYPEAEQWNLLEKMGLYLDKITKTETGALELDVKFTQAMPHRGTTFMIYENVPAVVDGFFNAIIWQGDIKVGQAVFTLPWNGTGGHPFVRSICLNPEIVEGDEYRVSFEPRDLWALEYFPYR